MKQNKRSNYIKKAVTFKFGRISNLSSRQMLKDSGDDTSLISTIVTTFVTTSAFC